MARVQSYRMRTSRRVAGRTLTITWNPSLQVIADALGQREQRTRRNVRSVFDDHARKIKKHMKQHHRWANRTGEAERKLDTAVVETSNGLRLTAWSGAPHGRFLEANPDLMVVAPTLDAFRPRLMEALRKVV